MKFFSKNLSIENTNTNTTTWNNWYTFFYFLYMSLTMWLYFASPVGPISHCQCRQCNNDGMVTHTMTACMLAYHWDSGLAFTNEMQQHKWCHFRLALFERIDPPRSNQAVHAEISLVLQQFLNYFCYMFCSRNDLV